MSSSAFGRNSLATTGQVQFDLRVLKFFKVGEHGKLDFVVESFNLFNHRNVVTLNQFYGPDGSPIPVFATANKAGIPRQLQLSVDFSFDVLNHSSVYPAAPLRDCARITG